MAQFASQTRKVVISVIVFVMVASGFEALKNHTCGNGRNILSFPILPGEIRQILELDLEGQQGWHHSCYPSRS